MTETPKIIGEYYKAGYFFENYLLEQAGADAESTMLTDIIPGLHSSTTLSERNAHYWTKNKTKHNIDSTRKQNQT